MLLLRPRLFRFFLDGRNPDLTCQNKNLPDKKPCRDRLSTPKSPRFLILASILFGTLRCFYSVPWYPVAFEHQRFMVLPPQAHLCSCSPVGPETNHSHPDSHWSQRFAVLGLVVAHVSLTVCQLRRYRSWALAAVVLSCGFSKRCNKQ